jgi:hypothetical protein
MRASSPPLRRWSITRSAATERSRPGAGELGLEEATNLLEQTLSEEKKTDQLLTDLAQSAVNEEAQRSVA